MNIDLKGKRALVCGSTQGIGKATAKELASLGASITLLARNEAKLKVVTSELDTSFGQKHDYLVADFEQPELLEKILSQYLLTTKEVHILVNNTGGPAPGTALQATTADYLTAFQAHLVCNHLLVQKVVPLMTAAHYGRIINVISTSVKTPIVGLGVSNTIRGAVASWAKTLAGELAQFGITVNNVLPGLTETPRLASLVSIRAKENNRTEAEQITLMQSSIPAKRFALPEETAAAIAFLASPSAAYINGINLPVDGGLVPTL
jgi:3-oxoacyl-[acyl-carrier protein] reductase